MVNIVISRSKMAVFTCSYKEVLHVQLVLAIGRYRRGMKGKLGFLT